jgi:predicted transcriptional regulator
MTPKEEEQQQALARAIGKAQDYHQLAQQAVAGSPQQQTWLNLQRSAEALVMLRQKALQHIRSQAPKQ